MNKTREFTTHLNVRLTDAEGDALRRLADELGLSLSELLRLLIAKGLAALLCGNGDTDADVR